MSALCRSACDCTGPSGAISSPLVTHYIFRSASVSGFARPLVFLGVRMDGGAIGDGLRAALLIIGDYFRCRLAQFKLGAHLLDLRCLPFQACTEGFNFGLLLCGSRLKVLSLLRDGRFLFLHLASLFLDLFVIPGRAVGDSHELLMVVQLEPLPRALVERVYWLVRTQG